MTKLSEDGVRSLGRELVKTHGQREQVSLQDYFEHFRQLSAHGDKAYFALRGQLPQRQIARGDPEPEGGLLASVFLDKLRRNRQKGESRARPRFPILPR